MRFEPVIARLLIRHTFCRKYGEIRSFSIINTYIVRGHIRSDYPSTASPSPPSAGVAGISVYSFIDQHRTGWDSDPRSLDRESASTLCRSLVEFECFSLINTPIARIEIRIRDPSTASSPTPSAGAAWKLVVFSLINTHINGSKIIARDTSIMSPLLQTLGHIPNVYIYLTCTNTKISLCIGTGIRSVISTSTIYVALRLSLFLVNHLVFSQLPSQFFDYAMVNQ